jgi:hypothetical protein
MTGLGHGSNVMGIETKVSQGCCTGCGLRLIVRLLFAKAAHCSHDAVTNVLLPLSACLLLKLGITWCQQMTFAWQLQHVFSCASCCFGMTELGHGSNVMGIETKVSTDHFNHGTLCSCGSRKGLVADLVLASCASFWQDMAAT